MIWLTWRQFRTQALAALAAVLLLGSYLVTLGVQIHREHDRVLAQCRSHGNCPSLLASFTSQYHLPVTLLGYLLIIVPGIIGMFWGAPLITRELELGTHRLVWNQSVTRRRWLAAKLGLVGLGAMAVTGVLSLLLTWAASPFDQVQADRFTPMLFGARNIAPVAYAAFAFVLAVALGLFVRRTLPAMALTLVVFAVVQIMMPALVRPGIVAPVSSSVRLTPAALGTLDFLGQYGAIGGLKVPSGDWVVSTSPMLDSAGRDVGHSAMYADCIDNSVQSAMLACLAKADLHVEVTEQPADRYWSFQWYESGIFTAAAAALTALCFWRIRGRLT
ncbi:ABC transporter permease subunit [Streptomyces sp. NPDC092296]|uniref:ABC transporter permease subunit n=1 Tax=Streptomyces sp. NPDC092296 TaxID=3366012 RepID=UPI0037FC1D32